jgi:hypothetical protein
MTNQTPLRHFAPASDREPVERSSMVGALAFVEGVAAGWGCWELSGWFEEHLVAPGVMANSPPVVVEQGFGVIGIDPRWSGITRSNAATTKIQELPRLLEASRKRVVESLRAFLPPHADDRFVHAAIYRHQVERRQGSGGPPQWRATPRETDRLSDIVLSLFAADILSHREFYETRLCVCEVCGRVSFEDESAPRSGCRLHSTRGHSGGFRRFEL